MPGAQPPQTQQGQRQSPIQGGARQQPPQSSMQQVQSQGAAQQPQQTQRGPPGAVQSQQPGMQGVAGGSPQGMQAGQGIQTSPGMQTGRQQMGGAQAGMAAGAGLLEPMTIDEAVQTDVYTVDRDTSVAEMVEEMNDLNVGSAVVTDEGTPVGIITDRKIAMTLSDDPNVVEQSAEELMSGEVVSAMEGTQLTEVLNKMSEEQIRRIPIVDESGELEGILALDDILRLLESKFDTVTDTIEAQYPEI